MGHRSKQRTRAALLAENRALKAQAAGRHAQDAQSQSNESLIQEKMNAGLTRTQAENVIKRQRLWDTEGRPQVLALLEKSKQDRATAHRKFAESILAKNP